MQLARSPSRPRRKREVLDAVDESGAGESTDAVLCVAAAELAGELLDRPRIR
jgi:hypothetical protein